MKQDDQLTLTRQSKKLNTIEAQTSDRSFTIHDRRVLRAYLADIANIKNELEALKPPVKLRDWLRSRELDADETALMKYLTLCDTLSRDINGILQRIESKLTPSEKALLNKTTGFNTVAQIEPPLLARFRELLSTLDNLLKDKDLDIEPSVTKDSKEYDSADLIALVKSITTKFSNIPQYLQTSREAQQVKTELRLKALSPAFSLVFQQLEVNFTTNHQDRLSGLMADLELEENINKLREALHTVETVNQTRRNLIDEHGEESNEVKTCEAACVAAFQNLQSAYDSYAERFQQLKAAPAASTAEDKQTDDKESMATKEVESFFHDVTYLYSRYRAAMHSDDTDLIQGKSTTLAAQARSLHLPTHLLSGLPTAHQQTLVLMNGRLARLRMLSGFNLSVGDYPKLIEQRLEEYQVLFDWYKENEPEMDFNIIAKIKAFEYALAELSYLIDTFKNNPDSKHHNEKLQTFEQQRQKILETFNEFKKQVLGCRMQPIYEKLEIASTTIAEVKNALEMKLPLKELHAIQEKLINVASTIETAQQMFSTAPNIFEKADLVLDLQLKYKPLSSRVQLQLTKAKLELTINELHAIQSNLTSDEGLDTLKGKRNQLLVILSNLKGAKNVLEAMDNNPAELAVTRENIEACDKSITQINQFIVSKEGPSHTSTSTKDPSSPYFS